VAKSVTDRCTVLWLRSILFLHGPINLPLVLYYSLIVRVEGLVHPLGPLHPFLISASLNKCQLTGIRHPLVSASPNIRPGLSDNRPQNARFGEQNTVHDGGFFVRRLA